MPLPQPPPSRRPRVAPTSLSSQAPLPTSLAAIFHSAISTFAFFHLSSMVTTSKKGFLFLFLCHATQYRASFRSPSCLTRKSTHSWPQWTNQIVKIPQAVIQVLFLPRQTWQPTCGIQSLPCRDGSLLAPPLLLHASARWRHQRLSSTRHPPSANPTEGFF